MRESEGVYEFGSKRVYVKVDKDRINVSIEIEIKNNSSFEILIKEYDLKLFFKGKNFANQFILSFYKDQLV